MNKELKNKKASVLLFCAVTVLLFLGCQTIEETISPTDLYDSFGARYYEPAAARFSAIDPVAEKYPSISPYAYCPKNPIYIDLKGDSLVNTFLIRDSVLLLHCANKTPPSRELN